MYNYNHLPYTQKSAEKFSFFHILSVLYIAHKVLPAVGSYMPSIVYLAIFALTVLMLLPMLRFRSAWAMWGFFGVSLLHILLRFKSLTGGMLSLYSELQMYLYGIIALRLIAKKQTAASRKMFFILLGMYIITAITTIRGNSEYPLASRLLATLSSGDYLYRKYVRENIGSFAFVYELVLITPLLIYLTRSKIIKPLLGYACIVLIGLTVFSTEYGMAVMLFAASLLLLFPKLTMKKLIILLVIILVIFLVSADYIADAFENLSQSMESETLSERFLAVAQTIRGDDQLSSDTGEARIKLYTRSLNSFVQTSFLGRWGRGGIGGHSFVFDTLGNFGLLGLLALICYISSINKFCLKPYRNEAYYPYCIWTCILAVVLMFLNPKAYPFVFLFVLPVFSNAFKTTPRSDSQ